VRGAATVTAPTRGYDAGKKISGRKTFGIVDALGLLLAVTVVAASASDNAGGVVVADAARARSRRFRRLWRLGIQAQLPRALPPPPRRRRSRHQDPRRPLRGPPEAVDRGAYLVMADE
jgi:hypothetical protein